MVKVVSLFPLVTDDSEEWTFEEETLSPTTDM